MPQEPQTSGCEQSAGKGNEFLMTGMNQQLDREIETVFLMADPRLQAIASRFVKDIARLGGDVSAFVTPRVAEQLKAKFAG